MTTRHFGLAIVVTLSVFAATIGAADARIPPEWNMRVDPAPGSPIEITEAVADGDGSNRGHTLYAGCVSFVNIGSVTAKRVRIEFINASDPYDPGPNDVKTLVRYGTFSPGVTIRGVVSIGALFGSNDANCSALPAYLYASDVLVRVTEVTLADGTTWTNPKARPVPASSGRPGPARP